MPTYQYACRSAECGAEFDKVQSFSDPAVSECPVCGGPVRKVFGAVGVVFKGSGFYRTDSRASAAKGSGKSGSSSEKHADSGSGSGAKPADKTSSSAKSPEPKSGSGSAGKAAASA